jgi:hypothetical protein
VDEIAVVGGGVVGAVSVAGAVVSVGTPEAVLVALLAAGVATGAASRAFQSEFRDAFFAGVLAWILAVTAVAFGFGGVDAASTLTGPGYNAGWLVYVAALGFAAVPGLCAAVGGELGARVSDAVSERVDA